MIRTDAALSFEGFVYVAPLAKDRQQINRTLAGVLHQELELLCRRAVVGGHSMFAVIVSDQEGEEPHKSGLVPASGCALADKLGQALTGLLILFLAIANAANWRHFPAVRQSFPAADYAPATGTIIFDIGGNKYRLISSVDFAEQLLFIQSVLTHEEYNREKF